MLPKVIQLLTVNPFSISEFQQVSQYPPLQQNSYTKAVIFYTIKIVPVLN